MLAWVFPGQGSQNKGMGEALFDEFPDLTAQADAILGYSIKQLCLGDLLRNLDDTQYTQPALFVVNTLTYLKKCQATQQQPDFVMGHSLGEYCALFAAGAIDFSTGVKLVQKRGALMGQASDGAMAAVVRFSEEELISFLKKHQLSSIDIANYNAPSQIVISGPQTEINQAIPMINNEGGLAIPLKVSAAFHSRYMQSAKKDFEQFLQDIPFSPLRIPVISNVTARPYQQTDFPSCLAEQITSPVKWLESVRYLMGKGQMTFEEVGPGNVLTKLITKIQQEAEPLVVIESSASKPDSSNHVSSTSNRVLSFPLQDQPSHTSSTSPITHHPPSSDVPKPTRAGGGITAAILGNAAFKQEYGLKYAYITGAMVHGIASTDMVIKMGKAGLMGYWGAGGMDLADIEKAIQHIQRELKDGQAYGMNLLCNVDMPQQEEAIVDLYLQYGIQNVEASAYMQLTSALVRYRLKGLKRDEQGKIVATHRVMAKLSHPEVASLFLNPAPKRIVQKLLAEGKISPEEADLAQYVPMATALCVESDSGGHTDQGVMSTLLPMMIKLRDQAVQQYSNYYPIWVGAAGGIGTPEAAATAFMLGADFILTGSINQCTVESGVSDAVKSILQGINVQDTGYAPAADMFELGAKVQVVRKGVFFPTRANKLYDLYRFHNSWDEIDKKIQKQVQEQYFMRGFHEIWAETRQFLQRAQPEKIEKAESNPKLKMALVFRWYLWYTMRLALEGRTERQVDFQIHCGSAMGAFNQWVKGTHLEKWQNRHVDEIAEKIMQETASFLNSRIPALLENTIKSIA